MFLVSIYERFKKTGYPVDNLLPEEGVRQAELSAHHLILGDLNWELFLKIHGRFLKMLNSI